MISPKRGFTFILLPITLWCVYLNYPVQTQHPTKKKKGAKNMNIHIENLKIYILNTTADTLF